MTQIDSKEARIEYLTAELNRLRNENDHLRLTYDPDGWRAEIERLQIYEEALKKLNPVAWFYIAELEEKAGE